MKFFVLALLSVFCIGCNTFHVHIEEIDADGAFRTTDIKIKNAFDSKSELTKLKTTFTEKTQGISVGGLTQENTLTNVVSITEAASKGVTKAFIGR